MQLLSPDFRKENVFLWEKPLAFELAAGLLFDSLVEGPVPFDPMKAWTEMQNRTQQGIYMGNGLLLPHARVSEISNPLIAFGVATQGISSNFTPASEKANLICMVLSPANSPTAHTKVIAKIATRVLDKNWVSSILSSKTTDEIFQNII